jgi:hypothetical protein
VGKKVRSSWGILSLVAVLSLLFATMPATGQTSSGERVLRLHLAADGDYWQWDGASPVVQQTITAGGNCLINQPSSPSLVLLQTSPENRAGMKDHSIGVKSGGSTGVPCSRVDGSEILTVKLAGQLADNVMVSAELDLELKKNAVVVAKFFNNGVQVGPVAGFTVKTGNQVSAPQTGEPPFAATNDDDCGGSSDSGPDSGINDNCRWTLNPGVEFDALQLSATNGEASLEGGGDFGTDPANDSLFFLKFNGTLACGQTISVSDGVLTGTFTRVELNEADCDTVKPWAVNLFPNNVPNGEIDFLIDLASEEETSYVAELTFAPHPATNPVMEEFKWDLEGFFGGSTDVVLAQWCVSATFDSSGTLTNAVPPAGFHGCIASQENRTVVDSSTAGRDVQTTWQVYFLYDLKTRG